MNLSHLCIENEEKLVPLLVYSSSKREFTSSFRKFLGALVLAS